MRPGQHNTNNNNNKNRNRNRNNNSNNRRNSNTGGGQQGGSGANRVYDSNGPDVKLRGTAQTIAEKYMQLARDANSSGDRVAAESYYQFGDHYYRVWLAAQPVGQPIQFARRNAEDEFDEDGNEIIPEAEGAENESAEGPENVETSSVAETGEAQPEGDGYQPRQANNNRNTNQNREGGNNRNFRQRWPRRNDRFNADGSSNPPSANVNNAAAPEGSGENTEHTERFEVAPERPERQERSERQERQERVIVQDMPAQDPGNWEAPSFLTRPTPIVSSEGEATEVAAPVVRAPRGRRPKAVVAEVPDTSSQGD